MGEVVAAVSIEQVLRGIGLTVVETVDPLDHAPAVETVRNVADKPGVKAIIFKSPCIAISRPSAGMTVDADTCIGCRKCIRELGCPALLYQVSDQAKAGKAAIDPGQCTACSLCAQLCPVGAIRPVQQAGKGGRHE